MDNPRERDSLSLDQGDDESSQSANDDDVSSLRDASFGIYLQPAGYKSGYHTSNDPLAPDQRPVVTNYHGSIDYQGEALEIIHGYLDPDSDQFATLLVYQFRFMGVRESSRISWASLSFRFRSPGAVPQTIKVLDVSPIGEYSLNPVRQERETNKDHKFEAKAGYMGMSLGSSYGVTDLSKFTTTNCTTISGNKLYNRLGHADGAVWTLKENKLTESGVPVLLRDAILLQRSTEDRFEADVNMEVKAKGRSFKETLFGVKDTNDPILYDPNLQPTSKLRRAYDTDNLQAVDLPSLFQISLTTPISKEGNGNQDALVA